MVSQYGNTFYCKSTDGKPSGVQNGRELKEMDTGKTYYYDAAGDAWIEWIPASGSDSEPVS